MTELPSDQVALLQQAIAALQAQRSILGDAVVDASLIALREQLVHAEKAVQQNEQTSDPRLVSCLVVKLVTQDRDPEHGLRVLEYSFNLLAEIVRQYGGSVQDVTGNCMIALFSGVADDPTRAAHAGLQMRQKVHDYGAELEQTGQGSISFRAGLNIGMLTVSMSTNSIQGEMATLNIADALAQAAPSNTILISQQIQTYLSDGFNMQSAMPIDVAQKRVFTYQLVDARQMVQAQHRDSLPEPPFLGRSEQLRAILQQIEQSGAVSVIVISGESGLGKTRLLNEAHRAAPMLQWMMAYSETAPIKPVYSAWNDLLMRSMGLPFTTPKKEIEKRLNEWLAEHSIPSEVFPILANQLGLSAIEDRTAEAIARQMVDTWQSILSALVRQKPTAIIFEEAQAMDSSSLALLERLVELLESLPVVWILATQPLYNQPAAATVMRLGRLGGTRYTYLGLEPTDEDKSLTLLYSLIGVKSLPDPLEAGIMERAQGNPLFIQHIVRALIEKRGLICDPKGRWVATAAALQDYMPTTLREVVVLRMRLLPDDAQQLLQWAAVAGDTVFPFVVKTLPPSTLSGAMNLLHDAGLLEQGPQYIHPAVRDAVYQAIPKQQRATMHRKVAAALAMHCELSGPWLAVRAYHMDRGLQTQGALDTYNDAKAWAYGNKALIEVSAIIGAMLELLNERDTPEMVASLLIEQQDNLYQLNPDDPRCKVLLDRAYGLWTELGNAAEAAGALLRMAVHHAGTLTEDHYYRDAQSLLERENPRHALLPGIYLRRALFIADQGSPHNAQAAEELFERARALALQLEDVETLAQIHFEMGLYLRNHHQLTEALAAFQQALSYFGQLEEMSSDERVLTCNYLSDLYYHLGHPAKGEYFALEAVAGAPRTSDLIQVLPFVTLSECYAAQARWSEAIQTIKDAPGDLAPPEMPLQFWLGRWTFEDGNALEGLEVMRESVPADNLECMMLFIDYLLDGSFVEEASIRLYQLVKQVRFNEENNTTMLTEAFYDRLRGRLAAANKDFSRATSLLDRAAHQFAREGYTLLSISTKRAYASALLARCAAGDEQAARSLLEESIAACKKLSIHAEARRLQNTLKAHWPDTMPR